MSLPMAILLAAFVILLVAHCFQILLTAQWKRRATVYENALIAIGTSHGDPNDH